MNESASFPVSPESSDNHLYFTGEIEPESGKALMRELRRLASQYRAEQASRDQGFTTPIWLHVNSPGGDLMTSFAIADQIERLDVGVCTLIEGEACSGATLISMAGGARYMTPNSMMMIHELSGWFVGKHSHLKDAQGMMDTMMDKMVRFYVKHSRMKKNAVRAALKHDSWYDAKQAQAAGFVEGILK